MPNPVIIRVAKLTSLGSIAASGQHTWRERSTPNANPELTPQNRDLTHVHTAADLLDAVHRRTALATDKATSGNPVLCLEYLVTANHDAFKEQGGSVDSTVYLTDALKWIEAKHGKENVVAANIQRDEHTPHLVVYVVPLVEQASTTRNRSVIVGTNPDGSKRREVRPFEVKGHTSLSAAHYVGSRELLRGIQTGFAEDVGKKHGLVRGVERSAATHKTIREHYAEIHDAIRVAKTTIEPADLQPRTYARKGLLEKMHLSTTVETDATVAVRLSRQVQGVVLAAEQAKREASAAVAEKRSLLASVRQMAKQVKAWNALVQGHTTESFRKVMAYARQLATEEQARKEQQRKTEKERIEAERRSRPTGRGKGR